MTDAPTTNDPVEIAMAAEAQDAAADSPARTLLVNQNRLVLWEIADRRAAFGLKLLMGLAGLAAAALLGFALWDASQARGLVIEAFSTPPDLAAKGLTGEVAAAQVVDRLSAIQATVTSSRAAETYTTNWGSDLSVQIPQTGVSVEAVQRLLRRWLGRQTRVSGEIWREGPSLKLTVRAEGQPAATAAGSEDDLDSLFAAGAENLLKQTQPYRYAWRLVNTGRVAEGRAALTALARRGPPYEAAWAHILLGSTSPSVAEMDRETLTATRLAPELPAPWYNLTLFAERGGRVEAARAHARELARLSRTWRPPGGGGAKQRAEWTQLGALKEAEAAGDYALALRLWTAVASGDEFLGQAPLRRARILALLHRPGAAEALLPAGANDVDLIVRTGGFPPLPAPRITIARARADWAAVVRETVAMEAFATGVLASQPERPREPMARDIAVECLAPRAEALARLGRIAEAEALAARTPADCYPCLIVRGQVASLAGDAARADRWFAEAARQAPSFAFAQVEWGKVKLARGDAAGALALARAAQKLAPRFADPVELEAEALLARGDARAAARRFAAADALSPGWGRLHLKWGQALANLGKADEARAQWKLAAGLDLTAAERAELARVLR